MIIIALVVIGSILFTIGLCRLAGQSDDISRKFEEKIK